MFRPPTTLPSEAVAGLRYSLSSLLTLILKGLWLVQTVPAVAAVVAAGTAVRQLSCVPQYLSFRRLVVSPVLGWHWPPGMSMWSYDPALA